MRGRPCGADAADPADRGVRIPRITPSGQRVYAKFAAARDAAEARALYDIDPGQRALLRDLLARIADRRTAPAAT
jgi:DNA-binding MarR family transcriptional regulator